MSRALLQRIRTILLDLAPAGREKSRSYTRRGPGVMPYRRRARHPAGWKLYRKAIGREIANEERS